MDGRMDASLGACADSVLGKFPEKEPVGYTEMDRDGHEELADAITEARGPTTGHLSAGWRCWEAGGVGGRQRPGRRAEVCAPPLPRSAPVRPSAIGGRQQPWPGPPLLSPQTQMSGSPQNGI